MLFPFDSSWTMETDSILNSEISAQLANQIHNFYLRFNMIHHLQGIHELGLDPGFGRPDFHGNSDVAFYQPTQMPAPIEARIGSQLVYERDVHESSLPNMGYIALRNTQYIAAVGGWWHKSKERADYERHDERNHFFFLARVYYTPPNNT